MHRIDNKTANTEGSNGSNPQIRIMGMNRCFLISSKICMNYEQILHNNKDFHVVFIGSPKMCSTNSHHSGNKKCNISVVLPISVKFCKVTHPGPLAHSMQLFKIQIIIQKSKMADNRCFQNRMII